MSVNDKDKLSVFYNATEHTDEAFDFGRDTFTLTVITTDFIYLGRDKPWHALYIEMGSTVNDIVSATTIEYGDDEDDATSFTALDVLANDSIKDLKPFARSGFIKWKVPVDSNGNGVWKKTTINSVEKFWARISIGTNLTASVVFQGINIVFSDDNDLASEDYGILKYLPEDKDGNEPLSHILSHVAARNWILQKLRNDGKAVMDKDQPSRIKFLDAWDLLDINEIREAAKWKALEKIYHQQSTSPDDIWKLQEKEAADNATEQFNLWFLSIDVDDDGVPDVAEAGADNGGFMIRG